MESISGCRLLALLFFCLAACTAATDVQYCKKGTTYPVQVSGVDIFPYPIVRETLTTFNMSASTGVALSGGKVKIDVNYWIFHVYSDTIDLCKETSCPVSVGDFVLSHQQTLPIVTPPGSYTLTMRITGDDGTQLTCITFGFGIGFISAADYLNESK